MARAGRFRPLGAAAGLALATVALVVLGAGAPPALAADWERAVGDTYPGGMRSVWSLESVAQRGSEWVFALSFTNGSRSARSLQLRPGDGEAAVLLVEGMAPVAAADTVGAAQAQTLKGGATARMTFRFPVVPGAGQVTLRTRWTIKQDMAADRFVEMEMPVDLH